MTDLPPTRLTEVKSPVHPPRDDWRGLFAELAAGRLASLDTLYDKAAQKLYGLALWRTGSEEDAADVVQDVFVKVVEQGPRLAKIKNPKGWLMTVTHRRAIDVSRRRRRHFAEPVEQYPFLTAAEGDSQRMVDAAQVSVLLSGLTDAHREVIYLRNFAGCTYEEIGEILSVPKFTAASRYRSGIQKLKNLMERSDDDE